MAVEAHFSTQEGKPEQQPAEASARLADDKELAFYGAVVDAWISSRMERDRHLMAYSAGGVGLLLTLATTVGAKSGLELVLYGLGAIAFLTAMICGITIFSRNARYLEAVVMGERGKDPVLERLDSLLIWSFGLGLASTATLAVSTAWMHL